MRELWYWGADEPDIIVDVTDSIDRQIAGLIRHESQVPGFNVPAGHTIGERVKKNAGARGGLRLPVRRCVPGASSHGGRDRWQPGSHRRRSRVCSRARPVRSDRRQGGVWASTTAATFRSPSLIARRHLEFQMPQSVPFKGTHVVVCDDDGRRAGLAAVTVERLGYRQVSVLDGGINRWVTDGFPTEWGMNVPSKDFGEKVEVVHHAPEVEAKDLAARIQKGGVRHPRSAHARGVPALLHPRRPQRARRRAGPAHHRHRPGHRQGHDHHRELRRAHPQHHRRPCAAADGYSPRLRWPEERHRRLGARRPPARDRCRRSTAPSAEGVAAAEDYAAKLAAEDGVRYST